MIQQEKLLAKLKTKLPNNLLLIGPKYSGKKTLVQEITNDTYYWVENKVDIIRQLGHGNYIFADVDDWSAPCFSAMLKLLEENEHSIILTCKNIFNIPESIQSRCIIEYMEPYININKYCDNIGQIGFFSEEMIKYIDKYRYDEKFDFDVYFSVACNRLLERISNGEDVVNEYLITCQYNSNKSLKSLNKKQFIANWQFDINLEKETI